MARPRALTRRPLVSVVIPCFNYADFVGEAITSVLTQEGVETEVVVVDDRSTDTSREVVRAIGKLDDRVRLVEHAVNRGPVETFNDGLLEVRGDYLVRLDADDLLTPGSLSRAVAVMEAFASVGLVYGHPLHFSSLPLPRARLQARRWVVWPGRAWLRDRCRTGLNVITSPEVVMRRSVVDWVGGQRPLPHTHDMEMWLRIAAVSDVAYVEGSDQAYHREHPLSLSQKIVAGRGDLVDRRDAFDVLFDWARTRLAEACELRSLAHRALAEEALTAVVHMHDRGRVDPHLQEYLLHFAETCRVVGDPPRQLAEARRLATRGPTGRPAPWRTARAASRRVRNEVEFRRWHRHGTFHRDAS